MPRIWLDYCYFLIEQRKITLTRKTFDKAIKSLFITQHDRIWEEYIKWAEGLPYPQTGIIVYQRFVKFNPDAREDFIDFLLKFKRFDLAIPTILDILDDEMFYSRKGKSKFNYWLD